MATKKKPSYFVDKVLIPLVVALAAGISGSYFVYYRGLTNGKEDSTQPVVNQPRLDSLKTEHSPAASTPSVQNTQVEIIKSPVIKSEKAQNDNSIHISGGTMNVRGDNMQGGNKTETNIHQ